MHRVLVTAARVVAAIGGAVLCAVILITVASIVGRALDSLFYTDWLEAAAPAVAVWLQSTPIGPINGDYEIVQIGMAFAIFSFLPICQITYGHATVDVFTNAMGQRAHRILQLLADLLFAAVLIVITTQLWGGMLSRLDAGRTTFQLEFPEWLGYAACLPGAVLAAVIGVYIAVMRVRELVLDQDILREDEEGPA